MKPHPDIERFYKAFPITVNMQVEQNSIRYLRQGYRPQDTLRMADELIGKLGLKLVADYDNFWKHLIIKVI